MENTKKDINANREAVESAMTESYNDAFNNTHMQFSVCITPEGKIYQHSESAGSSFIPQSVWNGTDYLICTYCKQYYELTNEEIECEIEEYAQIVSNELDRFMENIDD